MKTKTRTSLRPRTHGADRTATAATPEVTAQAQWREIERSVSLTGGARLRCRWYRLRLTIAEMNYAAQRIAELQTRAR